MPKSKENKKVVLLTLLVEVPTGLRARAVRDIVRDTLAQFTGEFSKSEINVLQVQKAYEHKSRNS